MAEGTFYNMPSVISQCFTSHNPQVTVKKSRCLAAGVVAAVLWEIRKVHLVCTERGHISPLQIHSRQLLHDSANRSTLTVVLNSDTLCVL